MRDKMRNLSPTAFQPQVFLLYLHRHWNHLVLKATTLFAGL